MGGVCLHHLKWCRRRGDFPKKRRRHPIQIFQGGKHSFLDAVHHCHKIFVQFITCPSSKKGALLVDLRLAKK